MSTIDDLLRDDLRGRTAYGAPQLDVPVALNTGANSGATFCSLYGSHQPYDAATLRALYPTHRDYVTAAILRPLGMSATSSRLEAPMRPVFRRSWPSRNFATVQPLSCSCTR